MNGEMLAYFHGNRVPKPLKCSKNSSRFSIQSRGHRCIYPLNACLKLSSPLSALRSPLFALRSSLSALRSPLSARILTFPHGNSP
jgi:hypothetical protein